MSIADKFDKKIDTKGLAQDVQMAAENVYKDVPFGEYEVEIERLELIESKGGEPMVTIWFKILAGEWKNQKIFYNQVITQGFQIHYVNELLRSLGTGLDILFSTYRQYDKLLEDIYTATYGKLEYALEYREGKANKKGQSYPTYKITEIFELTQEKAILQTDDGEDECPFD